MTRIFLSTEATLTANSIFWSPDNNAEHNWRWKSHSQFSQGIQCITSRAVIFGFEHFSFHHRIAGQCYDPYCSSKSLFYLSPDKTFLSMSGGHWSLRWSYCTTILCNIPPVSYNGGEQERCERFKVSVYPKWPSFFGAALRSDNWRKPNKSIYFLKA